MKQYVLPIKDTNIFHEIQDILLQVSDVLALKHNVVILTKKHDRALLLLNRKVCELQATDFNQW